MRTHRIKSTMRVYHVFNPHTAKEPISPFLASDWSMFVNLSVTKATRGRIAFMAYPVRCSLFTLCVYLSSAAELCAV